MNEFIQCMQKYADFTGRARRREYWMFVLFNTLILMATVVAAGVVGSLFDNGYTFAMAVYTVFVLGTVIPAMAVTVRRLHDVGRSGWWYFIILVPFVGAFVLLFWLCTDSAVGTNQWGARPKRVAEEMLSYGD
jgi:uncharacterized membrane protein YhaH (DUF805 family)